VDAGRKIANKDEEKAEALNAFFTLVLIVRLVIPRIFSPLSWKTGWRAE